MESQGKTKKAAKWASNIFLNKYYASLKKKIIHCFEKLCCTFIHIFEKVRAICELI